MVQKKPKRVSDCDQVPNGTASEANSRVSPVSLDEKSARTIARGRIAQHDQLISELVSEQKHQLPTKRLAWLRGVEADLPARFGKALVSVVSDKRRVCAILLGGFEEQKPGWLLADVLIIKFGGKGSAATLAYFSAHSVARLMERLRVVDPIDAMRGELLKWSLGELIKAENAEDLILPTKSGYFNGVWDPELSAPVFKTWLPDRLASDRERNVLDALRREERLGAAWEIIVGD